MKYIWLALLVWFGNASVLDRVSRFNLSRRQAERSYQTGHYKRAVNEYNHLVNNGVADAATHLNLGHAYFRLGHFSSAQAQYAIIRPDDPAGLFERAAVQLGIIACHRRDSASALALFKQALLINPDNETARYDFELIKRTWSGKQASQINQRKPRQELRPETGDKVAKSNRKEQVLHRLGPSGLTDEQARQLLDALPDEPIATPPPATQPADPGNRW